MPRTETKALPANPLGQLPESEVTVKVSIKDRRVMTAETFSRPKMFSVERARLKPRAELGRLHVKCRGVSKGVFRATGRYLILH